MQVKLHYVDLIQ